MHSKILNFATATLALALLSIPSVSPLRAQDSEPKPEAAFSTTYEDVKYDFDTKAELDKFNAAREASIYHKIGGKAAVSAAVDRFYVKVLADDRVNHFFEDVSMKKQHNKQKEFIAAALGSPVAWKGKDMRKAHEDLDLTEKDFAVIAGHLKATLVRAESPRRVGHPDHGHHR